MDTPNHHDELEQWAKTAPNPRGRKLTFAEKCGIAWVLRKPLPARKVANAFALSLATVSMLKHALKPDAKHYRDVWQELERLGPDGFRDTYYTLALHARLKRIMLDLPHLDENQTDHAFNQFGPDPRAAKYKGVHTLPDNSQMEIDFFHDPDKPGWAFRFLAAPNAWHGAERIRGAEGWEPLASSSEAFDAIYEVTQWPNPRPKPGRPRK